MSKKELSFNDKVEKKLSAKKLALQRKYEPGKVYSGKVTDVDANEVWINVNGEDIVGHPRDYSKKVTKGQSVQVTVYDNGALRRIESIR